MGERREPFESSEECALAALYCTEGIGAATLEALRREFGSCRAALTAPKERFLAAMRDEPTRRRAAELLEEGEAARRGARLAERCAALGVALCFPAWEGWPRALAGQAFPPMLFIKGTLAPDAERVAIVGSRDADRYGLEVAARFASALGAAGVVVVSGGALGIDAAAHRACVEQGRPTVAVLGCGLDVTYPREHERLYARIVEQGGALVSLWPPGTQPAPRNFLIRNRLIAALSDAVLVARAGATSGALNTAEAAGKLGRPLFAVPGNIGEPLSAGTNALLESGTAKAAASPAALASVIGALRGRVSGQGARAPADAGARPIIAPAPDRGQALAPRERALYEMLGAGPLQYDALLAKSGLPPSELAGALLQLELVGLCEERVGKVYARR